MAGRFAARYVKNEEWTSTGTEDVMVFYPTLQEMHDFSKYIQHCEDMGAYKRSGICKIVPPPEWSPRPTRGLKYEEVDDYMIKAPVRETINNSAYNGAYVKENKVYRKELSVPAFREMATSATYTNPKPELELREMERSLCVGEPIYGADSPGSLYDPEVEDFNIVKLGTILDLLDDVNLKIPGVNTPYLYFGMYKATFSWHTEDMDLYSINYLHFGEPKFWYAIPSDDADKFDRLAEQKFPEDAQRCKAYLRHKTFIITPKEIKTHGIRYGTMVQYPGEFIITFPRGYHMGFNLGYNCAESTNFALDRWIDFAKQTTVCKCVKGCVEIDMAPFMKKFRPDEFDKWYDYWYSPRVVIQKKAGKRLPTAFVVPSVELPAVKEDRLAEFSESLEDLRRVYHFLWQHQQDFKEEVAFNKRQGDCYPYCAICQYFMPANKPTRQRPQRSNRYTTDQLYSKSRVPLETALALKESRLLQCKRCYVVVHEDCYLADGSACSDHENKPHEEADGQGGKKRRHEKTGWTCKRCDFAKEQIVCAAVNCALCPLRGGALVPYYSGQAQPGQFVHVVCALMSRRTKVVQANGLLYAVSPAADPSEPALSATKALLEQEAKHAKELTPLGLFRDAASIPADYTQHEPDLYLHVGAANGASCAFCLQPLQHTFLKCQACFDSGASCASFHPTCALFANLHFEHRHFPYLALAVCPLHSTDNRKSAAPRRILIHAEDEDKFPLNEGDHAVFFSNQECDRVQVAQMTDASFYFVEFFDCSFSADVSLQDLLDCECKHVGCNGDHISGYVVTVRWDKGQTFQCYFRERVSGTTFTVESLTRTETRTCSRNALYRVDEPKPSEVEEELKKVIVVL